MRKRGRTEFRPGEIQFDPFSESLDNSGYGLRANYLVNGWDASLFFWSSPNRSPAFERRVTLQPLPTISYRPVHERVHQVGGAIAKDLGPAVAKADAVYTRGSPLSTADPADADGLVRSNVLDWIASVEFSFAEEIRLNLQFVQSRVIDREPGVVADAVSNGASVVVSTRALHPKIEPELLYITSFDRSDWNLQARLTWEVRPNWSLVGGVDLFGGVPEGYFGNFEHKDRVYGEVWYRF